MLFYYFEVGFIDFFSKPELTDNKTEHLTNLFCIFFWRARLCWPLLCLCRPLHDFWGMSEFELRMLPRRSKRARYQLSHPASSYTLPPIPPRSESQLKANVPKPISRTLPLCSIDLNHTDFNPDAKQNFIENMFALRKSFFLWSFSETLRLSRDVLPLTKRVW